MNAVNTKRRLSDRIAAMYLALTMLLTSAPQMTLSALADESAAGSGGFQLDISWQDDDTKDFADWTEEDFTAYHITRGEVNDPDTFVSFSNSPSNKYVTLRVHYSNATISDGYEPGQLAITVPGLKSAVRDAEKVSEALKATVMADDTSSTQKKYTWSYSYTEATDTYTFINNNRIESNYVFDGYFEIVWTIDPRETKHGYTQSDIQAQLTVSGASVTSNALTYKQLREKDVYNLVLEASNPYKYEISEEYRTAYSFDDYIWIKYRVTGYDAHHARDLATPEEFRLYFPGCAAVAYMDDDPEAIGWRNSGNDEDKDIDGDEENDSYVCYTVTKDVDDRDYSYLENIFVAYPRDQLDQYTDEEGKIVNIPAMVELWGRFYEEEYDDDTLAGEDKALIKAANNPTTPGDGYGYYDIPGPVYDAYKVSHGKHNDTIDKLIRDDYDGAIDAQDLKKKENKEDEYEYSSDLELYFNYDYLAENSGDEEISYNVMLVDDFMDIQKSTGLDQLKDDEYHFTSVTIMPKSKILDNFKIPIKADDVSVEIYVRYAGDDYKFENYVDTVKLTDQERTISFDTCSDQTDKKDVVGVKLKFKGLKENIGYPKDSELKGNNDTDLCRQILAKCNYVFHIPDDRLQNVMTDGAGKMINNIFCNIYTVSHGKETWFNNEYTKATYKDDPDDDSEEPDERAYYRDWDTYHEEYELDAATEQGFDREKAELPIVDIPNYFVMDNNRITRNQAKDTEATYYFDGSMTASFTLVVDTKLRTFSMVTIIPENLRLEEQYVKNDEIDQTLLKNALTFSVTGADSNLSSAYIAEHTNILLTYRNGRQHIEFEFDFPEGITIETMTISGLPMYVSLSDLDNGTYSIIMRAGVTVNQEGNWSSDRIDNIETFQDENGCNWQDIDNDGDMEEPASFSYCKMNYVNAKENLTKIVKYVDTPLTNGYVNPSLDEVRESPSLTPRTYRGGTYSYILKGNIVADDAKDIIIADVIEPAENEYYSVTSDGKETKATTEWQGRFVNIDYSQMLDKLIAEDGSEQAIRIYYSTDEETIPDKDGMNETMFTSGWTAVDPAELENVAKNKIIRSIAVYFKGYVLPVDTELEIKINMLAPETPIEQQKGPLAVNQWNLGYTGVKMDEPAKLTSNIVPVTYGNNNRFVLTKTDASTGELLDGAVFELFKDGKSIREYPVKNGRIIIDNLEDGDYYFVEIQSPDGYSSNDTHYEFNVTKDTITPSEITVQNTKTPGRVTIQKISDRKPVGLAVGVNGAEFALYKKGENTPYIEGLETGKSYQVTIQNDGKAQIDSTTDIEDGMLTIIGLEWGDYYLLETKAPDGYTKSDETFEFTINGENKAGTDLTISIVNSQKPVASVKLLKQELKADPYADVSDYADENGWIEASNLSGTPISGAAYDLYYMTGDEPDIANDKKIATMLTNAKGEIYAENLAFGEYYFWETIPAAGYESYEEPIRFTVSAADTVNPKEIRIIYTADSRKTGNMLLRKLDDDSTPQPVKGAAYGLFAYKTDTETGEYTEEAVQISLLPSETEGHYAYSSDGTEKILLTNDEGVIQIEGLLWGKYYIVELEAPTGYELSNQKFEFELNSSNVHERISLTVTDARLKGNIKLEKVAQDDNSIKLDGAEFTLYKNDGTVYLDNIVTGYNYEITYKKDAEGKTVRDEVKQTKIIDEDQKGTTTITGLEWGSYYFMETKAPAGYSITADKIRFSVNYLTATKTQEIVVEDPPAMCELEVTKKILKEDIVFAHGNPTFIFEVKRTDSADNRTYRQTITFTKTEVENAAVDSEGYIQKTITFAVPAGTYEISEVGVNRYECEGVEVDAHGTKHIYEIDSANKKVTVTLTDDNANADPKPDHIEFIFKNRKNKQTGTSDTALVSNVLKTKRKLTAIIAQYTGPETTNDSDYDFTDDLTVYAVYDDGEQVVIPYPEYTLQYAAVSPDTNGEYTVEVSYTEDGITRKDYFTVRFYFNKQLFTWVLYTDGDIEYDTDAYDGLITITGYLGTSSQVDFPEALIGAGKTYKVVKIGNDSAVTGMENVDTITFAEGIRKIGSNAFQDRTGLVGTLELPDTLIEIGNDAFNGCSSFTGNLELPASLTKIGDKAFYGCEGFSGALVIPDHVTYIGVSAFEGCRGFNSTLTLGSSVETIGNRAFYFLNFTGQLIIPSSVRTIGEWAFYSTKFTGLTIQPGVTDIKYRAFMGCSNLTGSLDIPSTVTLIGEEAFYNCSGFSGDLTIGEINSSITEGTTSIGTRAFEGAAFKGNLIIGDNVDSIGSYAFNGSNTTFQGTLHLGNNVTTIGNYAFQNCNFTGSLVIPNKVETIGQYAFASCQSFMTLDLGNSVKIIDTDAFYNCTGFTGSLTIPDTVTYIGNYAFNTCRGFTGSLTIGKNVSTIGSSAFGACFFTDDLTIYGKDLALTANVFPTTFEGSLYISEGVVSIANGMFGSSSNFNFGENLEVYGGMTTLAASTFKNTFTGSLAIGGNVTSIGANAFKDYSFTGQLTIGDSVTSIGNSAFQNCKFNGELIFSDYITTIGTYAFSGCSGLSGDLTIPDSVTSIGFCAFENCGFDGTLTLSKNPGYTNITQQVFQNNHFIGDLIIPDNVTTIAASAFKNAGFTGSLTIGKGVTSIGTDAFTGCGFTKNLTVNGDGLTITSGMFPNTFTGNLTIDGGVTSIGNNAFSGFGFTGDLTIGDSVTTLGYWIIRYCTFNGTVTIGNGLTSADGNAFSDAVFTGNVIINSGNTDDGKTISGSFKNALKGSGCTLTIGGKVEKLGTQAFSQTNITSVVIGDSVTEIGDYAFWECTNLTGTVTIPQSVTKVGTSIFYTCNNLTTLRVPRSLQDTSFGTGNNTTIEYYD